jgi:hypothetical protein
MESHHQSISAGLPAGTLYKAFILIPFLPSFSFKREFSGTAGRFQNVLKSCARNYILQTDKQKGMTKTFVIFARSAATKQSGAARSVRVLTAAG